MSALDKIVPYLKTGRAVPEELIQEYSDELIESPREFLQKRFDDIDGKVGCWKAIRDLYHLDDGPLLVIDGQEKIKCETLQECLDYVCANYGYKNKSNSTINKIKLNIIRAIYRDDAVYGYYFVDLRKSIKLNNITKPDNILQDEWDFYRAVAYHPFSVFPSYFEYFFSRDRDDIPGKNNRLKKDWEKPFRRWLKDREEIYKNPECYIPDSLAQFRRKGLEC